MIITTLVKYPNLTTPLDDSASAFCASDAIASACALTGPAPPPDCSAMRVRKLLRRANHFFSYPAICDSAIVGSTNINLDDHRYDIGNRWRKSRIPGWLDCGYPTIET